MEKADTCDLKMKLINRDRGLGKTTEAVKQAHRTGAYIIVKDRPRALYCMQLAEELHLNIRFPITFGEFLDCRMRGSHVRNIIIDDAHDLFLSLFRGLDIEMITMNVKDIRVNHKMLYAASDRVFRDEPQERRFSEVGYVYAKDSVCPYCDGTGIEHCDPEDVPEGGCKGWPCPECSGVDER